MTQSGPIYQGDPGRPTVVHRTVAAAKAGVSFGSALAIAISWSLHKSILWAIVHGFFGWLYVIYYALTR
ncbi:MAG: hypothetical protein JWO05_1446 [Gemmatimonadetes bacterium]|nr:hypothetical protein [Gemmatimonadota bacterium]